MSGWVLGASGQMMQMARAVKRYDLVFPVAQVWAALKKKRKNLMSEKEGKVCDKV